MAIGKEPVRQPVKLKQCTVCHAVKPATLEYFHASSCRKGNNGRKKTSYYLRNICKVCRNHHLHPPKEGEIDNAAYKKAARIVGAVVGMRKVHEKDI